MNKTIKEITLILLLSVGSSILINTAINKNISIFYTEIEFKQGRDISTKDAYRLFHDGNVLFIDSRSKGDYEDGHIKDAENLPIHSSRVKKINFMNVIPRDGKIVIYCVDANCPSAKRLTGELNFMGYKNVMIYSEGWIAWESKGYPVERNIPHE